MGGLLHHIHIWRHIPVMENQREKNMEHELETGFRVLTRGP